MAKSFSKRVCLPAAIRQRLLNLVKWRAHIYIKKRKFKVKTGNSTFSLGNFNFPDMLATDESFQHRFQVRCILVLELFDAARKETTRRQKKWKFNFHSTSVTLDWTIRVVTEWAWLTEESCKWVEITSAHRKLSHSLSSRYFREEITKVSGSGSQAKQLQLSANFFFQFSD